MRFLPSSVLVTTRVSSTTAGVASPPPGTDHTVLPVSRSVATTWSVPRGATRPLRTLLRLDLNASPALRCSIVSIAPRAPYSAGAGIVSMVAVRPDGSGARLCLHLIVARTGRGPTRRARGSRVASTQDSAPTALALPPVHQRSRTLQIVR